MTALVLHKTWICCREESVTERLTSSAARAAIKTHVTVAQRDAGGGLRSLEMYFHNQLLTLMVGTRMDMNLQVVEV